MEFHDTFTSSLGVPVHYHVYEPNIVLRYKGVVQLHHSLYLHSLSYHRFASFLANRGFIVVISDFVSHGQSNYQTSKGYYGKSDGMHNLVKDMHRLKYIIQQTYPDIPYFMMAQGLGTIALRYYLLEFASHIDGAILLSTPYSLKYLSFLRYTSLASGYLFGKEKPNRFLSKRLVASIHQKDFEWLSKDENIRNDLINDPLSELVYSNQGYYDIFNGLSKLTLPKNYHVDFPIPLLLASGKEDPVSHYGKDLELVSSYYQRLGFHDITLKCYDNMRFALLHEKEYEKVSKDIAKWLEERSYI